MSQGQFNSASNAGCMHGIIVQDPAARGQLWVQLVLTALNQGRPCVLITGLDPSSEEFSWVIQDADDSGRLQAAIDEGLLSVFLTVDDYGFNLFRLGAQGLLSELDEYGVKSGSVIVIDQADEFFTPHDPAATQRQAGHYRHWCNEHGHQLALLFLRSSPVHPPLAGNQAAFSYFTAMFGASMGRSGLRLERMLNGGNTAAARVESADQFISGSEIDNYRVDVENLYSIFDLSRRSNGLSGRRHAWYVGTDLAEVSRQWPQYAWRTVENLDQLTDIALSKDTIVVDFSGNAELPAFARRLLDLRRTVGSASRIVVRETDRRIRKFPQSRLLKAAGVSVIVARHAPVQAVEEHSDAFDPLGVEQQRVFEALMSGDEDLLASTGVPDLPLPLFVDRARSRVNRNEQLGFPCTLAEVAETDLLREALRQRAPGVRPNDLSCHAMGSRLWLLQGCPASEAVRVIQRVLQQSGVFTLGAVTLFSDAESISARLEVLASLAREASTSQAVRAGHPTGRLPYSTIEQTRSDGRYSDTIALAHAESIMVDQTESLVDAKYCFKLAERLEFIGQFSAAETPYSKPSKDVSRESQASATLDRISGVRPEPGDNLVGKADLKVGSTKNLFEVESAAQLSEGAQGGSRTSLSSRARSLRKALRQTWPQGESDGILPT